MWLSCEVEASKKLISPDTKKTKKKQKKKKNKKKKKKLYINQVM